MASTSSSQPTPQLQLQPISLPNAPPLPALPSLVDTDPTRCILDAFRISIAQRLCDALPPLTLAQAYSGVDYGKKGVDFTVALPRFRLPGKVDELAGKVIEQFKPDEYVQSVTHDKAFLHFQLTTPTLITQVLTQITSLTRLPSCSLFSPPPSPSSSITTTITTSPSPSSSSPSSSSPNSPKTGTEDINPTTYGTNTSGAGKKVVIEYSSPNIAKSFHVGHLRSTIIGAFLANLYKSCGWDVVSMNYLGDWGTQFGLIATGFEKYGSQSALLQDPIKHLFEIYVQINKDASLSPLVKSTAAAFFKRMESGDPSALENWKVWRELSVRKYEEEYERLNVRFDVYNGESMVGKNAMQECVRGLEEKGIVKEGEGGAKVADLEKWKMGTPVLVKGDGTSIYLTRDMGGAVERYAKYKFDKMIYVISSQQDLHVSQLFKMLQLLEFPWANSLQHVNYGLVLGMSTRKGTVVFLDEIIKEAAQVMHEQMMKNEDKYSAVDDPETTSREIGISGVKIQDMAAKRINNYTFNWDRMKSFEGDTGPYLQYAHVRLASIARKNPTLLPLPSPSLIDISTLSSSPHAREIIMLLASYPDVVKTALKTHEPSGVVTFAFRLAHGISSAWETVVVKGEEDVEKKRARMWMYECAREVLGTAMRLLSLRPLERM